MMKKRDIRKHLDNIIIDGIIKEAEQENAEFGVALCAISDEEFIEIVGEPVSALEEPKMNVFPSPCYAMPDAEDSSDLDISETHTGNKYFDDSHVFYRMATQEPENTEFKRSLRIRNIIICILAIIILILILLLILL